MKENIVSIIIPTYNLENCIEKTLESIINQSSYNFEIILVDDGSTDKTIEKAFEIMSNHPKLSYKIISKENGGVSSARNRGLLEASGKYILFLDGDDLISKNLVQEINKRKDTNSDILIWKYNTVSEDNKLLVEYSKKFNEVSNTMTGVEALNSIILQREMWIWTGSAAYSREFLLDSKVCYTEGCRNGEDQEFTFKVLAIAKHITFISDVLSFYVIRNASVTNSYNINCFDAIYALYRTNEFLENINKNHLFDVIKKIKNSYLIESYIFNFDSCLKNNRNIKINDLFNDIEKNYFGLNQDIFALIQKYSGENKVLSMKLKLLMFSPKLYHEFIKIYFTVKRGLKR